MANDIGKGVKRYLASLDEPPLPDRLWQRVEGTRRRRMRARTGAAAASAAVLVLALAATVPGVGWRAPGAAPEAPRLADEALAPPAPLDDDEIIQTVRAIDRALQAAYDRNASDAEIAPLWEARQDLVQAVASATTEKG